MDIIKTGMGLKRTMRNMVRLREIVMVFARNGFGELLHKSNLKQMIPGLRIPEPVVPEERDGEEPQASLIGQRLRRSFEELGPTFVKLGQLLSSRHDLFDKAFIAEMQLLLNRVKGIPFSEALTEMEKSLKRPWTEVFQSIDEHPIGTASIGLVYRAQLLSGEAVVIKLRRPHIQETVRTDLSILYLLIASLEHVSAQVKYLGLPRLINDFENTLHLEMDFNVEVLNWERLKSSVESLDEEKIFYFPKVFREWSNENLIVMEFLDGISFQDVPTVCQGEMAQEVARKLIAGARLFIDSLLSRGIFHADLHGGNFFYLKNGQIGLVDYGIVGGLSKQGRMSLVAILYSLMTSNYYNLTYEFLEIAEYETIPDIDRLVQDIKDAVDPLVGLSTQQLHLAKILAVITKKLIKHRIYIPRDWFIVFRALTTLEGVGRSLNIDFDVFGIVEEVTNKNVKNLFNYDDLLEEGLWRTRDWGGLLRVLPRHAKWFLKDFARKGHQFDLKVNGLTREFDRLSHALVFVGVSILASVFFYSGVLLFTEYLTLGIAHLRTVVYLFWSIGFVFICYGLLTIRRR